MNGPDLSILNCHVSMKLSRSRSARRQSIIPSVAAIVSLNGGGVSLLSAAVLLPHSDHHAASGVRGNDVWTDAGVDVAEPR